jgi:Protein of unknown function (DUF1173)
MQSFLVGDQTISTNDTALQAALANAHAQKLRPECLCVSGGVPMYIAHVWGKFVVKRMPNSGTHHHPDCDSYEPPAELSGLGQVEGTAIQEDPVSGLVELKLDFTLSKGTRRTLPIASATDTDSVRTDGQKLTLRGTLHYLWDQARLNRWTPSMAGKRSWFVVRKHLLLAAENKTAKGAALGQSLFIPETFSVEAKEEILQRRLAKLTPALTTDPTKLHLLIGEVKQIDPARFGQKLTIKHLPDFPFMVADDLSARIRKRFASELALWNAHPSHLIAVATFGIDLAGVASIEELSLVVTTDNWLPIEHVHDLQLLNELTHAGRRFTKALRYNLTSTLPLATATLTDTQPLPIALYAVRAAVTDEYKQALHSLIDNSALPAWVWLAGKAAMPPLPPVLGYQQAESAAHVA